MVRLEELKIGSRVLGVHGTEPVTLETVHQIGPDALRITYHDREGRIQEQLLFRSNESDISVLVNSLPWNFQSDGERFKLVSEAVRIRLAYLFDPYMAIHTSSVEPLPHQISAVYETMLTKLPLRFILADDPGAGKTIMTGLFLKELFIRGDLKRCLIVCPGNLAEQWQEELFRKFALRFEILTNEAMESAISGNVFIEKNFCIARLDKLARNEFLQQKLQITDWDLIVVDEAHKMSATVWGNEVKYTRRFQLGRLLSGIARNFLLLTATPHNGKEADFQLFLSLLDSDRFAGTQHGSHEKLDVSDIMRRLVKEELLKFDGTKLFPERMAYTVNYDLSPCEAELYDAVTEYVRNEFHNADSLDHSRRSTVGFALTILQRRLASSPEAIWQSLGRRRKRLEKWLEEFHQKRSFQSEIWEGASRFDEDFDEDELPSNEMEEMETDVADQASAAQSVAQLEQEIETLKGLEAQANAVRMSGEDRKWDELSRLLQDDEKMRCLDGTHEKLILFTEHRDTLNYLAQKLISLLGSQEAVVAIHGGMSREERHRAEEQFKQNPEVRILLATDAAGEGINLQRAHLMINYDLPWNPNRLEQRFGRIHRIGQTEVCHLWNLVAKNTREGDVFQRLFTKLEEERVALGGRVFDILGKITFDNKPLRDLLIEAIRYGSDPKRRAEFEKTVDSSLNREELKRLLNENALTEDLMDIPLVTRIREEMERREAYKLQPFYIESFFVEAFRQLGGSLVPREKGRWEIRSVPSCVKNYHDPKYLTLVPIVSHYERITFDKKYANLQTELLCPGHPLLEAVIALTEERNQNLLKDGTVFIDENDSGTEARLLFYIENVIQDGVRLPDTRPRVISRQLHFVEMKQDGSTRNAGYAPYLDYRPAASEEIPAIRDFLASQEWLVNDVERLALDYATSKIVPEHYDEVRKHRLARIEKITNAVKTRLSEEIRFWDLRAWKLSDQEKEGKKNSKLNSENAQRRANELAQRKENRLAELEREKQIVVLPPNVIGGALIIPVGLLNLLEGKTIEEPGPETFAENRSEIERIAMNVVMEKERSLGFIPRDVSMERGPGYDIESWIPENLRTGTETLRFIEVKGRTAGAETVTVSRNEILAGKNKGNQFILAIVEVEDTETTISYIQNPFRDIEPGFTTCSINLSIQKLIQKS